MLQVLELKRAMRLAYLKDQRAPIRHRLIGGSF
jgi:hypothetical protein